MSFEIPVLSVSELTENIKYTLESTFDSVIVSGEISNFKPHFASGHWYFTLKDDKAQISCNMWSSFNSKVKFKPADGMKVIVTGKIGLYAPRGTYSIDCRTMAIAGEGELFAAFERLKKKLSEEGLFDKAHKKEINKFPKKIGIITAVDSAAMKDMVRTATRRYPLVEIVVIPTKMQGEGAADEVVESIAVFNKRNDIDTIIIARGGGSIEDLWAFNEEIVARAIYDSRIPIISGVGHETDYTIADFVADVRASTPTAAMEIATPNKEDFYRTLEDFKSNKGTILINNILQYKLTINRLIGSYGFKIINDNIRNHFRTLDNYIYKISNSVDKKIADYRNKVTLLEHKISANDLNKILEKGFALVIQEDTVIRRKIEFKEGTNTKIKFFDGEIKVN
jgi:exodeoxyribonuclease VII large subunit